MKRFALLSLALSITLAATAYGQDAVPAKESPLKTLKDKASYGIGLNFGRQAKANEPKVDVDALMQGLKDGMARDASYGMGFSLGRQLAQDEIDLDLDLLKQGVAHGTDAEAEPLLTETQLRAAMVDLQKQLNDARVAKAKAENAAFLAENKAKEGVKTTDSGLQYLVMKSGDGASPKASDTVKVHYHGTLIDGTVFDSSVQRGEPAQFGVGQVIKGWTEALQLMKVGDKWKLFIPSELAYGERSAGPVIGPNSVLVFEVELIDIVK